MRFPQHAIRAVVIGVHRDWRLRLATGIIRVALVALASMSAVAYGQNNVATAPSTGVPVHPGTAILDAMGIFAGAPAEPGPPVTHASNGNSAAATEVIPK
jgi:hypothetical protein